MYVLHIFLQSTGLFGSRRLEQKTLTPTCGLSIYPKPVMNTLTIPRDHSGLTESQKPAVALSFFSNEGLQTPKMWKENISGLYIAPILDWELTKRNEDTTCGYDDSKNNDQSCV
jgi:hypothetical protein